MDLLDLTFTSQRNGEKWTDKDGRIFVRCSIVEAGKMVGRKERVAKGYLKELRDAGLIDCKRNWSQSNTIYVCYPDDVDLQLGEKTPDRNDSGAKNCPIVGRKTAPTWGEKPPTKLDKQIHTNRVVDSAAASTPKKFTPPSVEEAKAYFTEKGGTELEAEDFVDYFESNGWKVGKTPMKDWKAAARRWMRKSREWGGGYQQTKIEVPERDILT